MAPQGGIYKSWGEYRAFGELGRNGPLRGEYNIWGIGEEWAPSGGINK